MESAASDTMSGENMAQSSLFLIIGEPFNEDQKELILERITRELRSWNSDVGGDLNGELAALSAAAPAGEDGANGERTIQHESANLLVNILINPQVGVLRNKLRSFLLNPAKCRHIVYSGLTLHGSWFLQDDIFSLANLAAIFKESEVEKVAGQLPEGASFRISTESEGEWSETNFNKQSFVKSLSIQLNPTESLADFNGLIQFAGYLTNFVKVRSTKELLLASEVVGNIRFSRPTLYIFPGAQGDSSLFGISGFNLLVNGGYSRKACFWDFTRHLDRIDALLMTHLGYDNLYGPSTVFERKVQENVHPEIGHVYFNSVDGYSKHSPNGDAEPENGGAHKTGSLSLSLVEEGNKLVENMRNLGQSPNPCIGTADKTGLQPLTLYAKVGHGTLYMYVLNPMQDSKELKDFLSQWSKGIKNFVGKAAPLPNQCSVCALVVWKPSSPNENITRILFPGNVSQQKVFDGLDKMKNINFLQHPICSEKSMSVPAKASTKKAPGSAPAKSASKPSAPKASTPKAEPKEVKKPASKVAPKASPQKPVKEQMNKSVAGKPATKKSPATTASSSSKNSKGSTPSETPKGTVTPTNTPMERISPPPEAAAGVLEAAIPKAKEEMDKASPVSTDVSGSGTETAEAEGAEGQAAAADDLSFLADSAAPQISDPAPPVPGAVFDESPTGPSQPASGSLIDTELPEADQSAPQEASDEVVVPEALPDPSQFDNSAVESLAQTEMPSSNGAAVNIIDSKALEEAGVFESESDFLVSSAKAVPEKEVTEVLGVEENAAVPEEKQEPLEVAFEPVPEQKPDGAGEAPPELEPQLASDIPKALSEESKPISEESSKIAPEIVALDSVPEQTAEVTSETIPEPTPEVLAESSPALPCELKTENASGTLPESAPDSKSDVIPEQYSELASEPTTGEVPEEIHEMPTTESLSQPPSDVAPDTTEEVFSQPPSDEAPQPAEEVVSQPLSDEAPEPAKEVVSQPPSDEAPQPAKEVVSQPLSDDAPEPTEEVVSQPPSGEAPEPVEEVVSQPPSDEAPEHTKEVAPQPPSDVAPEPTEEAVSQPTYEAASDPAKEVVSRRFGDEALESDVEVASQPPTDMFCEPADEAVSQPQADEVPEPNVEVISQPVSNEAPEPTQAVESDLVSELPAESALEAISASAPQTDTETAPAIDPVKDSGSMPELYPAPITDSSLPEEVPQLEPEIETSSALDQSTEFGTDQIHEKVTELESEFAEDPTTDTIPEPTSHAAPEPIQESAEQMVSEPLVEYSKLSDPADVDNLSESEAVTGIGSELPSEVKCETGVLMKEDDFESHLDCRPEEDLPESDFIPEESSIAKDLASPDETVANIAPETLPQQEDEAQVAENISQEVKEDMETTDSAESLEEAPPTDKSLPPLDVQPPDLLAGAVAAEDNTQCYDDSPSQVSPLTDQTESTPSTNKDLLAEMVALDTADTGSRGLVESVEYSEGLPDFADPQPRDAGIEDDSFLDESCPAQILQSQPDIVSGAGAQKDVPVDLLGSPVDAYEIMDSLRQQQAQADEQKTNPFKLDGTSDLDPFGASTDPHSTHSFSSDLMSAPQSDLSTHASASNQDVDRDSLEREDPAVEFDPLKEWGQPMGLPAPENPNKKPGAPAKKAPASKPGTPKSADSKKPSSGTAKAKPPTSDAKKSNGAAKTTDKKGKLNTTLETVSAASKISGNRPATKRPATAASKAEPAPAKAAPLKPVTPFYLDLTYIPNHGEAQCVDLEFFRKVRARYYVLSSATPNPSILDALVDAKLTWENPDLEVTLIPTYDTDALRHWMALKRDQLSQLKIDIAPSASRCTIQLQDHETSCAAYRLEF